MGRFSFSPVLGQRYLLKVSRPVDVVDSPKLPAVVKDLPVIDTGAGVFDWQQPIKMQLRATKPLPVIVRAVCRGRLVGEERLQLREGDNPLTVSLSDDVGGVVRVTLFDATTSTASPRA